LGVNTQSPKVPARLKLRSTLIDNTRSVYYCSVHVVARSVTTYPHAYPQYLRTSEFCYLPGARYRYFLAGTAVLRRTWTESTVCFTETNCDEFRLFLSILGDCSGRGSGAYCKHPSAPRFSACGPPGAPPGPRRAAGRAEGGVEVLNTPECFELKNVASHRFTIVNCTVLKS
jgi:hypothetical protein